MGTKENFNQALHEVFPFYKKPKEADMDVTINSSSLAEQLDREPIELKSPDSAETQESRSASTDKKQETVETTYITKDTKITGTIISKANLDINGYVLGDVESRHDIRISGKIEGNVKGENIEIDSASVKGNIQAAEHLNVMNQSTIVGDIYAARLDFNSKINGNINVKKDLVIKRDSSIVGDITATTIDVEKGAVIKSQIAVTGERTDSGDEDLIY